MNFITSLQNAKIKEIVKLRKNKGKESKTVIIDSPREIRRALEYDFKIHSVFFTKEGNFKDFDFLKKEILSFENILKYQVSEEVFAKISYKKESNGILVLGEFSVKSLAAINKSSSQNKLLLIGEGIEKPGNLGALMRTADGAGVDYLIVADKKCDLRNPNVIRASTGTIFSLGIIESSSKDTIKFCKENGIKIVVADPYAKDIYYDIDYRNQDLALVVGTEDEGVSELMKENADIMVRIPMWGMADSLNVNQAGTVILYEIKRQMKGKK